MRSRERSDSGTEMIARVLLIHEMPISDIICVCQRRVKTMLDSSPPERYHWLTDSGKGWEVGGGGGQHASGQTGDFTHLGALTSILPPTAVTIGIASQRRDTGGTLSWGWV